MPTFILLRPEAIQRNLVGKLISVIEEKGLRIIAMKMIVSTKEQAKELYAHAAGNSYFQQLIEVIVDSPSVAIVAEAPYPVDSVNAVLELKKVIRLQYAAHDSRNVFHCSDSTAAADKEIRLFFSSDEWVCYEKTTDLWLSDNKYIQRI